MTLLKRIISVFTRRVRGAGLPSCVTSNDLQVSWNKELTTTASTVPDAVGIRTDTIYYGQYISAGTINLYRTSGTYEYIDPSDGSSVTGVSVPVDGLVTVPANGICNIEISDGSKYPCVERAGNVIHDIVNDVHISASGVSGAVTVLDFDTSTYVTLSSSPDPTGVKSLTFKLYMKRVYGAYDTLLTFRDTDPADFIRVTLVGSEIGIYRSNTVSQTTNLFDITGILNEVVDIKIIKYDTQNADFYINDVQQTPTGTDQGTAENQGGKIGGRIFGGSNLSNAYIWDISMYDDPLGANTLVHNWDGTGSSANADSAWVDTVGSINGTVFDSPGVINVYTIGEAYTVINFDGVDDGVTMTHPTMTGNKRVTFRMYLDNSSGYSNEQLFTFGSSTTDHLNLRLNGSNLIVILSTSSASNREVDISSYSGAIVDVEIVKSTSSITSVSFDTVSQTLNATISSQTSTTNGQVGIPGSGGIYLQDATIWDINIYDDPAGTNVLTNSWYGAGSSANQDVAWIDDTGGLDGTVGGTPATRIIESESGSGLTWAETLHGSDWLNQIGFVTKSDYTAAGYDWESIVDGSTVTLDDDTLVPLKADAIPFLTSLLLNFNTSNNEPVYVQEHGI
jgi:hypothetical protein